MAPPPESNLHPLFSPDGRPLNHPANLLGAYQAMADDRRMSLESFASHMEENFEALFEKAG